MRKLFYLLREAVANMRTNRTTTVVAVATTAFTFACVGVFLLLYVNLRALAGTLQEDVKVAIYVADNLSREAIADLDRRLNADRAVASVAYVSKEQALAEFQSQFPSESHLLEGLGQNPLPASFVVKVAPQFQSSDAVKRWVERTKSLPGVAQVEYSQDWIETLATMTRSIELAAMGVGLILSTASVTIIANTIRLTLYARRGEIEILQLIGATTSFVRIPYLLEGALLGALGSALSLVMLKVGFELFRQQARAGHRFLGVESWLTFFPFHLCALLVAVGVVLGFAGSLASLLRFGEGRA